MRRIHLSYLLILLYLGGFAFFTYPRAEGMQQPERGSWWLSFGLYLLVWALAYALAWYRRLRGTRYEYGYYPEHKELNQG